MKFENNNKEIIKRITNRSLRTNKVRNIFAILAIILTTFMMSSVFSIGISFVKNYGIMKTRLAGTTANISLQNPTEEQISKIKTLDIFKNTGSKISVGNVSLDILSKNKTSIQLEYHDKDNYEKQLIPALDDIKGSYPTNSNDIMISRLALELLKKSDANIGDKISIPCKINNEVIDKEFTIRGIFTSYGFTEDTGYIYVSESFIKENKISLKNNGLFSMTVKNKYKYSAEDILKSEVNLEKNQKFNYSYIVEDSSDIAISTAIAVFIISAFIIVSGYLLIYNVLYIAVTKDINFYGRLKTLGASPRQIKRIVKGQALKLSIIGIPIGLALGAIVSFGVVPVVLGMFFEGPSATAMPSDVSFSPVIFILAASFSLITVLVSCRKPAKIASSISPIEAMRYTGSKPKKQKKNRNTTNGGKLYKMAWYNVFRDKKRAILVFLSLFMGIVTFLSVNTFIDSIKVENYINKYVPNDFELQNIGAVKGKMNNDILNNISNITGVESIDTFKLSTLRLTMNDEVLLPALKESYSRFGLSDEELNSFIENSKINPEFMNASIIGVSDSTIEKIYKENKEKFDLEAFKEGKLILVDNWYYGDNYKNIKGKQKITNPTTNKSLEYDAKVVDLDTKIPSGLEAPVGIPTICISESALEKIDSNPANYLSYINVEEKYESKIKAYLQDLAKSQGLNLEAKTIKTEEFKKTSMVQRVLGGGVSLILILIGVLNFVNVMITGINIRLKELAIMESIGMTKKQIKKMLVFEGVYYAGITTLLICTLGTGIIFGISALAKNMADYAVFTFPAVPLIFLTIIIFIICFVTPSIVFKACSKQSVTERIREIEE